MNEGVLDLDFKTLHDAVVIIIRVAVVRAATAPHDRRCSRRRSCERLDVANLNWWLEVVNVQAPQLTLVMSELTSGALRASACLQHFRAHLCATQVWL